MPSLHAPTAIELSTRRFRSYGPSHIDRIVKRFGLSVDTARAIKLFSLVLPFRVNEYVVGELIDWSRIPDDPIYQLVFPQPGMLSIDVEQRLEVLSARGREHPALEGYVRDVRAGLNPHPAGQRDLNVPDEWAGAGIQHKYLQTVLYFPSNGQTCHAYCTYCFRWPQFVGDAEYRFASSDPNQLVHYLRRHPEVTDVLVTGGDPMVMSVTQLRRHLEPLLTVDSVRTIRLGTKSLAYWPQRFVTDRDADDTLELIEQVVRSDRQLAVMAHISHPRELETNVVVKAVARLRDAGAVLYSQAPVIARVNDDGDTWADLWRTALAMGVVPYYLFVPRDTGPREYFKVSLSRAYDVFQQAYRQSPGLARTVRGPVMSTTAGKVVVDGPVDLLGQRLMGLRFLQARDPSLVGRPFFARWSESASWIDELELDESAPPDIAAALGRRV